MTVRRALTFLVMLLAVLGSPAVAEDLRFAVFGDCQPPEKGMRYAPALPKLAGDMARQKVAFVLGAGDYVRGGRTLAEHRQQYQGFFAGLAPLQSQGPIPCALAPGNHDILGSQTRIDLFTELFSGTYHSFDRAGCHFIILCSEQPGLSGRIAGKQLQWLKSDLASHRSARLTFVVVHRPLFPVSVHRGESLDVRPAERDALHQLFVREGVDCVFHGHEHFFHREQRNGVDYIITGGGGGPLYAKPSRGGYHHYTLISVTGSEYAVKVRKLS